MIREATHEDLPLIVELGAAFLDVGPYREFPLDREAFAEFAGRLIDGGVILLSEDGMLGGLLSPLYFNPSLIMGAELFWYAKKTGVQLREAFEAWARERGASGLQFSGLVDQRADAIRRVFARAGYQPAEQAFFKRF